MRTITIMGMPSNSPQMRNELATTTAPHNRVIKTRLAPTTRGIFIHSSHATTGANA